jgi:hypothetical protein
VNRYWLPLLILLMFFGLLLNPNIIAIQATVAILCALLVAEIGTLYWAARGQLREKPGRRRALTAATWITGFLAGLVFLSMAAMADDFDGEVAFLIALIIIGLLVLIGCGLVAMFTIAALPARTPPSIEPRQ